MKNINQYKLIFIGWNPFQFMHIEDLAYSFLGSVFVLEDRKNGNIDFFYKKINNRYNIPIIKYAQKDLINLDDEFNIIIAQSKFYNICKFNKAKIIFLQYGYAKDKHNFGIWRALATLNLVFGEYAFNKLYKFTPVEIIGNPKYIKLYKKSFWQDLNSNYNYIDRSKKTLLYLPTWGRLSSYKKYINEIIKLSNNYNILIKIHHNSDFSKEVVKDNINNITYYGSEVDTMELIVISDIVISDYSGAIFDAIYCEKPLILLNISFYKLIISNKISFNSLELKYRKEIAYIVNRPNELSLAIDYVLANRVIYNHVLRDKLFVSSKYTVDRFKNVIYKLINSKYKKKFYQIVYNYIMKKKYCFINLLKKIFKN